MSDESPLPEIVFQGASQGIAATAWLASVAAHATAVTILVASQGWIATPPQMGSRSGPSSMPSKPSPGDPNTPDSNEPRGAPLVVTLEPPLKPLPAELILGDELTAATRPDAADLKATFAAPPPVIRMESIVQVAAPVIVDLSPAEKTETEPPLDEAQIPEQDPPTKRPEPPKPVQPEERPATPPLEPAPAKAEPAPVGKPAPPTIASLPSDGNQSESMPRFRANSPVHYPLEAVRQHIEGTVTLRLQVAIDGRVTAAEIAKSSGYELLDRAASETVRTWRGEPSRIGGQPVAASILLPVEFRLQ